MGVRVAATRIYFVIVTVNVNSIDETTKSNCLHVCDFSSSPPIEDGTVEPRTVTVDYETWVDGLSVAGRNVELNAALTRIIRDLPANHDWLDPEVEKWARQLI